MELTGTIARIKDVEKIPSKSDGKDFLKRELWLNVPDGKFSETLCLEFHNERTELVDSFAEGQEVTVDVNLKGKVVGERCFNTFQAWKIKLKK
jgi:hypothetical protein